MKPKTISWISLYGLFGLFVVLLYAEARSANADNPRVLLQASIVILIYWLFNIWANGNFPFDHWS
jgi:hypothetical protein